MAKTIKPLNPSQIDKAKPKDKDCNLFDGDGMYLLVRHSGTKVWMLRFKDELGKVHKVKLGSYPLSNYHSDSLVKLWCIFPDGSNQCTRILNQVCDVSEVNSH